MMFQIRLILKLASSPSADQPDNDDGMLSPARGCILVFLPGVPEIMRTMRLLQEALYDNLGGAGLSSRISAMALHGGLSPSEQAQVFRPCSRAGAVKLVLATNVAEVIA